MITTIKSKYVGVVRVRRNKCLDVRYTFEDRIERYIKRDLGIRE